MNNFWCTSDTIPDGLGYSHFSGLHLFWLAVLAAAVLANWLLYRKLGQKGRGIWRKTVALLLIADELFKLIPMLIFGNFQLSYLPFHLCSINIFICVINSFKRDDFTYEVLYSVCIPGASLALLMPTWTDLPFWNFMSLHSNSIHVLLVMYPLLLLAGGFRPNFKRLPKVLLLLLCECVPIYFLNKIIGTNFFFLNGTSGNPVLKLLASVFGKEFYFIGCVPILLILWVFMYLPWFLAGRKKQKV